MAAVTPADLPAAPPEVARVFGDRADLAEHFAAILATRGVEHGLIGPREIPRLWQRHVLNCAVVAGEVVEGSRVVDVGSGAGLPGLLFAVARPDLEVILVEPLLRRTTWLEGAVAELGIHNVEVRRGKAEAFWGDLSAPYVTARAVARLDRLAGWCLPLLQPDGLLLALKGSAAGDELREGEPTWRSLGAVDGEIVSCGVGVVDPPTTVVRLRMGPDGPRRAAGRQGMGRRQGRRGTRGASRSV